MSVNIHSKNPTIRDKRGKDTFNSFSIKNNKDPAATPGKIGSSKEYRQNYYKVFKKK